MAREKRDHVVLSVHREHSSKDASPVGESRKEKVLQSPLVRCIASSVDDIFPSTEGFASQRTSEEWRTTFLRFGPLSGVFCMLLSLASLAASFGVLAGSNHHPTASWSTTPSTYLAIFTAIANLSVRYAAFQGIVIAWWFKATKGTSLARLHWDWKAGTSFTGALFSGRRMGLLGLACVLSTIVVIDGPLLQRASKVISAPFNDRPISLDVLMAPETPSGYTGSWATFADLGMPDRQPSVYFNGSIPTVHGKIPNDLLITINISMPDTESWFNHAPLHNAVRGCPGRCKGKLRAPALASTECVSWSVPVNYLEPVAPNRTIYDATPLSHDALLSFFTLDVSGQTENVVFITGFANVESPTECTGSLTMKVCSLMSAIGEYDITVEGGQTFLDAAASPRILAIADNTQVARTWDKMIQGYPSTLGGIITLGRTLWQGLVWYYPNDGKPYGIWDGGDEMLRFIGDRISANCPSFGDPSESILASLNKLMVYVGASAALEGQSSMESFLDPGLEISYTMIGYEDGNHNVYVTDYWYFFGAALVEIVCIALVIPTYWGWWKIGRACSFSPLEVAKAFRSPLLADCNSNSSGRALADISRGEVRYGVLPGETSRTVEPELAFGSSKSTVQPTNGMHLGP